MRHITATSALLLATASLTTPAAQQSVIRRDSVERQISSLVEARRDMVVGVSAVDIDSDVVVSVNAAQWFPMASTYKVPIAMKALDRVARGELSMEQMVTLRPTDMRPGSDLSMMLQHDGAALSVANLLDLSISISDNTAADRVLGLAGGPESVTSLLRTLGIADMNVNRSTLQVLLAFAGSEGELVDQAFSFGQYQTLTSRLSAEDHRKAALAAAADRRDSATPAAMSNLLRLLARGHALPPKQTEFLLATMLRARGSTRIRGFLPPGAPRASHKSGTLIEAGVVFVNDVGILRFPGGRRVALSVFIKNATASLEECEQVIGHIARAVYDFYATE